MPSKSMKFDDDEISNLGGPPELNDSFFFGPELRDEFRDFQKKSHNMRAMLFLFCIGSLFFFCRCNIENHFDDGWYFSCSFLCTLGSIAFCTYYITAYFVDYYITDKNNRMRRLVYYMSLRWVETIVTDCIPILGTLGVAFGLYGRVMNGPCGDEVSLWESQRCNPSAESKSIPLDHFVFLILLPAFAQTLVIGMTFRALVICWTISLAGTIVSFLHLNANFDLWLLIGPSVIIVTTFRYEELRRMTFSNKKRTAAAEKEKQKCILLQQQAEHQLLFEKNNHESEIHKMEAEEECRLMIKEQLQMVALIGNIAHDLKTPLQSFMVDLEALETDVDYRSYLEDAPDGASGPRAILTSLQSTCRFMSMAINRSIDFAKASRNIALVPQRETINMFEDLLQAVNVIRHLKSSLEIVVNPLPLSMCLFVITDKHWFAENLLCLLSNAVKYSDGGIVTLTVEHIAPVLENVSDVQKEISNSLALLTDDKSGQQVDEAFNNLTKENALTDRPVVVSGPMIKISVEDFGIGIPEEDRVELFQPFKQVQRLAGGTGLGLFSLSTRISALDGSRGMSSRKDGKQGSVFWFSIPYLPDPNYHSLGSPDAVKSPSLGPSGSSTPVQTDTVPHTGSVLNIPVHVKNRLRFLLVDDSPSILKVVGRALESKKYDVDTAVNGSVALSLLIQRHSTRSLDVVLMDLQMPVMDGIEAVRRYREYETAQHKGLKQDHTGESTILPADYTVNDLINSPLHGHPATATAAADPHRLFIIGMSANSDAVTKQCAHDVGMDAFLAKPFAIADLQLLVDSIRSSSTI